MRTLLSSIPDGPNGLCPFPPVSLPLVCIDLSSNKSYVVCTKTPTIRIPLYLGSYALSQWCHQKWYAETELRKYYGVTGIAVFPAQLPFFSILTYWRAFRAGRISILRIIAISSCAYYFSDHLMSVGMSGAYFLKIGAELLVFQSRWVTEVQSTCFQVSCKMIAEIASL